MHNLLPCYTLSPIPLTERIHIWVAAVSYQAIPSTERRMLVASGRKALFIQRLPMEQVFPFFTILLAEATDRLRLAVWCYSAMSFMAQHCMVVLIIAAWFSGSPEKFVLFIGRGDMVMLNGRDIVARDLWGFQELPFHPDGSQTRWRDCGGRASGQSLPLF